MSKKFLVTGAAGFIGSHTTEALLARGDQVVGVDNFNDYYDPALKRENLAAVRAGDSDGRLDFLEGDIGAQSTLADITARGPYDAIIHLAAMAGVRASIDAPALYFRVNVDATVGLLELALAVGRPNFVFASTSSVYGHTKDIPFVETDVADRPLAPYPASKRAGELLGHAYHHCHGIDFTALRFFTVYGPRNRPDMMAFKVLDSVYNGTEVPLYNAGDMGRDWTFVTDIAAGVIAAADRRLGYERINIGRGEPVGLRPFIERIEELTGRKGTFRNEPAPATDMSHTHATIDKARNLLGYEPKVTVDDGVTALVEWYRGRFAPDA